MTDPENVVISSGFGRLHLALTAREASERGLLRLAITGAYPTRRVRRTARLLRLADKGRIARMLDRGEGIPEDRLRPQLAAELWFECVQVVRRVPVVKCLHRRLHRGALRLYGRLAARQVRRSAGAQVFHYLAAYGHASIDQAHAMGMTVVCDHAIAHPLTIDPLIDHRGRVDLRPGSAADLPLPRDHHWRAKLEDLSRTDAVVVNSEFVRQTFLAAGWPGERVHVAYLGVDEGFFAGIPQPVTRTPQDGPLRLLYAGRVETRKGVDVLFEALAQLSDLQWDLTLAGPIEPDVAVRHAELLADERIRKAGTLLRSELRNLMLTTSILVFPSYAEGSARVIFEALACGCYVITTPNAGSVVQHGEHGALIEPGSPEQLVAALRHADQDRRRVADLGTRNARLVATRYRQRDYGDRVADIWDRLAVREAVRT